MSHKGSGSHIKTVLPPCTISIRLPPQHSSHLPLLLFSFSNDARRLTSGEPLADYCLNTTAVCVCVCLGTVEKGKAPGRCSEPEAVEPQCTMGTVVSTTELTQQSMWCMNLLRCDFDMVPTFPFESVNVLICAHGCLRVQNWTRAHEQFVGSEFVCIYFSATVKNAANNNKSCDKLFVMIVAKHTQASAHTQKTRAFDTNGAQIVF